MAAGAVYELGATTSRVVDLQNPGNIVGAQSEILHFAGRNLGMLGGAALGWETGPGAFVTIAVGGVIGAVAGEKIIEAVDHERIYTQADPGGQRWHFDPQQPAQGWTRTATTAVMGHGMVNAHTETTNPPKTAELNRASDAVIAQNIANAPPAIAARYQAAYEQYGRSQFGPPEAAVTSALKAPTNSFHASDGHEYTRGIDGQWTTPGRVFGTNAAEGNLRAELEVIGTDQGSSCKGRRHRSARGGSAQAAR